MQKFKKFILETENFLSLIIIFLSMILFRFDIIIPYDRVCEEFNGILRCLKPDWAISILIIYSIGVINWSKAFANSKEDDNKYKDNYGNKLKLLSYFFKYYINAGENKIWVILGPLYIGFIFSFLYFIAIMIVFLPFAFLLNIFGLEDLIMFFRDVLNYSII